MAQTNQLAFLKRNGASKKTFSTKISEELDTRLRDVEKRIAKEAPQLSLDRGQIVEDALNEAIEKTEKYLNTASKG